MKRTKQFTRQFEAIARAVILSHGCELDARGEGHLETQYGPVRIHVYSDWVACSFAAWQGEFPASWYGWQHWKRNFHYPEIDLLEEVLDLFMIGFQTDKGLGFPSAQEITTQLEANHEFGRQLAKLGAQQ